jgi:hypothetical protein
VRLAQRRFIGAWDQTVLTARRQPPAPAGEV